MPAVRQDKMLSEALKYAAMGWYVIPLKPKDKSPLIKKWQEIASNDSELIMFWWQKWPNANIGLNCGLSGLVVIDLDEKPNFNGRDPWDKLAKKYAIDTNTPTSLTGGGGLHLFYKAPDGVIVKNSAGKLGNGVDVRGHGGYVVAPPSIHPNGNEYKWDYTLNPKMSLNELPQEVIELLKKANPEPINSNGKIKVGERETVLCQRAGAMRRRGMSAASIEAALLIDNQENCDVPLEAADIHRIACSIGSYPHDPNVKRDDFLLTDLGNAERFENRYMGAAIFCHGPNVWHIWDGKRWGKDTTRIIQNMGGELVKSIMYEMIKRNDTEKVKKSVSLQSYFRINAMLELAKSKLKTDPKEFDSQPMILNCRNGIVDLTDGTLRAHDPSQMLSKIIPVEYNSEAKCPRWESFIDEIMLGNSELIPFLQCLVGYSLTGDTSEQYFYILYGSGENGKSTFLNTVMAMLGDYAITTPAEGIMAKRQANSIPHELARLPGIRLTSVSETDFGQRLSEATIKQLTGGEELSARPLYGNLFTFKPICKLFLQTNHKPDIRGRDHAIWRRVVLIPFNYQVDPDIKDLYLGDKLKQELPGILNWAVKGCLRWQEFGLTIPNEVWDAVDDYREESDILGQFISEICEEDKGGSVRGSEIRRHYKEWIEVNNEDPISPQRFAKMLSERYRKVKDSSGNIVYRGLRLKSMEKSLFGITEDGKHVRGN